MSKLTEFYDQQKTPPGDRLNENKPVILVLPHRDFEWKGLAKQAGLDPFEVTTTWPKEGVVTTGEVELARPVLTLQAGCSISRKYRVLDGTPLPPECLSVLPDRFVNLHHHDEFSFRDGLGSVSSLVKKLQSQRRSMVCVTNHGSLAGWIRQYSVCKSTGMKAIFGVEMYNGEYRGDDPAQKIRKAYHMVLLARTMEGYQNIIRLHNDAQLNGFYYTPRANREGCKRYGKGVFALSGCQGGEISTLVMAGKMAEAREVYEFYAGCFDRFFIELVMIESPEQIAVNRALIQFAKEVKAPLVVSCDSHYVTPEHFETHNLLLLIREHKTVQDVIDSPEKTWQFQIPNLYHRTYKELRVLWQEGFRAKDDSGVDKDWCYADDVFTEQVFESAVKNTRKISLACESIKLDPTVHLPKISDKSNETLTQLANDGLGEKGLRGKPEYQERLEFELNIICTLGWADYFLIMHDIVGHTKRTYGEFAVGHGRGSAAGSLVSYCLQVTDLDPIKHGLLFERFLDFSRGGVKACSFKV